MTQTDTGPLAPATRLLGYAGLLPQVLAVLFELPIGPRWWREAAVVAPMLALFYGAVILSFLGGIWWGFATGRRGGSQARLATIAVVPSLVAFALLIAAPFVFDWALVGLGSAILLTLLVDRHLVSTGEAPQGWLQLRVPLSAGLGALTILVAILARPLVIA